MQERRRGEDIIDFGMGNPDQPAPQHVIDKLVEASQRKDTHRYSMSRGIPRLRRAICNWYKQRYEVDLDPESEAIITIGSKEGLSHLAMAVCDRGDLIECRLVGKGYCTPHRFIGNGKKVSFVIIGL